MIKPKIEYSPSCGNYFIHNGAHGSAVNDDSNMLKLVPIKEGETLTKDQKDLAKAMMRGLK